MRRKDLWRAVKAETLRDDIVAEEAKLAEQERRVVQTRERLAGMREQLRAEQPPMTPVGA